MSGFPGLPVGRLVAEFGVIVIGVLVALFAESAWQERGNRAEEAEVLARIQEEVRADSSRLATAGAWLEFVLPAAERVPGILAGRDTLPPEGQLALLYGAATVNRANPRFWTWDELRETGRSALIRDADLRSGIQTYFGLSEAFDAERETLPDQYRAVTVGLIPPEYTYRVLERCLRDGDRSDAPPRSDAFAALSACRERPETDPAELLAELRERPDLQIEAGRLAYELGLARETFELLRAQRDTLLAAFASRGVGSGR